MQPTPSADVQEKMRMCKFCIHSHISDLGYNHCWESGSFTYDGDSPMGVCWAFRDKREWKDRIWCIDKNELYNSPDLLLKLYLYQ